MKGLIRTMIGILLLPGLLMAADDFSSLEERMSGDEYSRAGLDKLSAAERAYLNQWLRDNGMLPAAPASAARSDAPVSESQMGLRSAEPERVVIESRISGEFTGWSGRTRFKLANGQVWEQVGGGNYYHSADNPAVRIEPKSFGAWKMYVEGIGRGVKVKRIK